MQVYFQACTISQPPSAGIHAYSETYILALHAFRNMKGHEYIVVLACNPSNRHMQGNRTKPENGAGTQKTLGDATSKPGITHEEAGTNGQSENKAVSKDRHKQARRQIN